MATPATIKNDHVIENKVPKNIKKKPVALITTKRTRIFVESEISSKSVVIFSKSWCPHCTNAKNILNAIAMNVTVHELDQRSDISEQKCQKILETLTGARTVPRVFFAGKCVGGADDIMDMSNNGKLREILTAAGVATKLPTTNKRSTKKTKVLATK